MATLAVCLIATVLVACEADSAASRIGQPVAPSSQIAAARQRLPHAQAEEALAAVLAGNERGIASAPALVPPGAPLAPFIEARLYAIANLAVHDALNAIVPRFARYADTGPLVPDANAAAAVVTAAHGAIVGAAPASQAAVDSWYAVQMTGLAVTTTTSGAR